MISCKECHRSYEECKGDDNERTHLCPQCFEGALEEYEIRKRERIARENEY